MADHFDPGELRDPHGKWSKGGALIDRLSHEAGAGAHAKTLASVQSVKPGAGKQINGHWMDRPASGGYRVKLKKPGERGRDTKVYASPEDAAQALHSGSHTSPATERAAREVTRPVPPLAGPEDIARKIGSEEAAKRKAPARAPEAPRSPRVPAGVPSEAELRDKTPAQLQEIANITRGQGDYPGRELTLQRIRSEQIRRQPTVAPKTPATEARTITATGLKPGMVVSSGHWQAPKGQHEVAKVEKSGAGTRSGGVMHAQGIYNTASTHITDTNGRHYQVSNNTKFKVHKEAPAATDIAARRSAQAAEQGRLADIQAKREFARVESKGSGSGRTFEQAHAEYQAARSAVLNSRVMGGNPGARARMGKLEEEMRGMGARPSRTKAGEYEIPKPKTPQEKLMDDIHNVQEQIDSQHLESGSPHYSARELANVRSRDIQKQLDAGHTTIVMKVPSGSEIQTTPEVARELLGIPAKGREGKGTPPAGMTPELQAQLRNIQGAEKARVEAENKATGRGGTTINKSTKVTAAEKQALSNILGIPASDINAGNIEALRARFRSMSRYGSGQSRG